MSSAVSGLRRLLRVGGWVGSRHRSIWELKKEERGWQLILRSGPTKEIPESNIKLDAAI